nr:hypothetical protein [Tanacetum cinerariifolium]
MFDRAFKRVNTFVDFRIELVEESSKKVRAEVMEGSSKRAGTELEQEKGKKTYYQIFRADGSSKMYLVFSHMLKDFDREDVKTLWKLVKAKHESTRPDEGYERVLWGDLKVMFNPHVEDEVWKLQQRYSVVRWALLNTCRVHCLNVDEAPTTQTMFMANLSSADPITDEAEPSYDSDILSENKVAIGYKNPLCLTRAKQAQPALYNEDTLEIADITRKKMNAKMTDPECVTHKKQLTPEQIYWSNDLMKLKSEALKEQAKVSRPIRVFTVYPPNTPATLVPKVLPTKSHVKIHIFTLIQMFSEFNKTCKKRITPTSITNGEWGFEQTKSCYLQEVIPFFKTIKYNFEGIQKALTKEVKEMKDVFEELEAEVAQCAVDRKHDAIDLKNPLIANDNLIAECLSKEMFSVATKSELNVAQFAKMHVANTSVEARCLALEAELATLRDKSHQENQGELIKHSSKLEITRAKHIEQVTQLTTENVMLKTSVSKAKVQPSVLTRTKHAVDVEPIVPRLRNNRDAHLDYLRHLKESVETIHDIVEEAKVVRPLDRSIVSACRYTKHSQKLLEYVIGTCPQGSQQRAKQLANTPLIRKKQVTIAKPSDRQDRVTSYPKASGSQPKSNPKTNRISPAKGANKLPVEDLPRTNKSHLRTTNRVDSSSRLKCTVINLNSDSMCRTCKKCLTSFDHDMCVAICMKSVMRPHSTSHNCEIERKMKQVWKPKQVGKV